MLALYVPSRGPKDQRNVAKRAFQEAVTESLPQLLAAFPGMPVTVAGDLNVIERGHQPPHKVSGDWEYDFYDSFQAGGLTDAFRHLHPDGVAHLPGSGAAATASASTTSSSPHSTPSASWTAATTRKPAKRG
ncbi:hypothetical protein [Streptomyces lancefieldiae]|uniref:Endonuclease/exonuclease/phosphatase domain-containing protein n=1 Tax=Streptomyces lancefieldiae TaxID=3075520 RepID=A0ABU3B0X2_9ACTN|nr:hypothetical protein [Streptomyces sp. DSM 40712]MDT0615899.1 hypothetical protein [Streptomyces sp. DSM 40712]